MVMGIVAVMDVRGQGRKVRMMMEMVFAGRGRTMVMVAGVSPAAGRGPVGAATVRLARIMLARAAVVA